MFDCKDCGMTKPATDYRIHKRGYRIGKCRDCESRYMRERYQANPVANRARKAASMAKRRAANPDANRAYQREWHAKNRDRSTAKMRDYYAKRFFWGRAMKLRGPDRATFRDLAAAWKRQRGLCALTGRRLDRSADLDHIVPKTRGGSDRADNLRWLCREANMVKRNLTDEEFFAICADAMRVLGTRIQQVEELAA